jgi:peptide/nickel transport system permease protein
MAVESESVSKPVSLTRPVTARKHRTLWGDVWVQFRRHKPAMFGLAILLLIIVGVLLGPLAYQVDPAYIDFSIASLPPTAGHPFGTDDLGRDTLARNLYGGRISISVGLVAMLISITIGTIVGGLSGYFPKLDNPLMRFTDMMLALPQLPLLLVIIMLFRDTLRQLFGPVTGIFILIVFVIGALAWMPTARVVRGSVLSIKEKEFVEAAIGVGSGQHLILLRHILPNVLSPIIVSATLGVAGAILTESALSFLGLGFPSDVPTWGRLLFDGKDFLTFTPFVVIWPGLFISLTVLGINFMGDGLRDALDPKLRK